MSGQHTHVPSPGTAHEHDNAEGQGLTRRQALQAGAVVALGAAVVGRAGAAGAAPASPAAFAGTAPLVAAMHVHAVYSEGPGSWEQQYANAVAAGADVLFQTDHDFRARATAYMQRLSGTFTGATTGSWSRHAASFSASGPIHLLIESSGSGRATQSLVMETKPTAVNKFRTGIDGQTFTAVFGSSRLDAGALFEIVLTLSLHPAQGGRARGQYSLRYRYGRGVPARRFTEGGGLAGVVQAPMPANGSTLTLTPQTDIAAIWPSMLAIDHSSFLLSFVATSPRHGVVADVRLQSVTVNRARHDAAGVLAAQRAIQQRYSAAYGITGIAEEEVSIGPEPPAHLNPFGATAEWGAKPGVSPSNWKPYYRSYIERIHAAGGVVSWNHAYGASMGPLLTAAQQTTTRRQVFAELFADDLLGADIMEVGYKIRGHMPIEQHLNLWDTFSRRGRYVTGNGASDDHSGNDWRGLVNGYLTGIWAASTSAADLVSALRSGRAYTFHPGRLPGLQLDTLVDGTVPMGKASVSSRTSRTIDVSLGSLPSGCTVELVRGPVDGAGQDPGTTVVMRWSPAAGSSTLRTAVDTSSACFVRAQVRRNGALVGTGNPTWLLRSAPAGGIPPARQG